MGVILSNHVLDMVYYMITVYNYSELVMREFGIDRESTILLVMTSDFCKNISTSHMSSTKTQATNPLKDYTSKVLFSNFWTFNQSPYHI